MGFLDSLTDVFTGRPAKEAAANTRGYLSGVGTQGRSDLEGAYNTSTSNVNAGADSALGYLGQGRGGALGQLEGARGSYAPLSALGGKYGTATTLGLDALGVNGQEGNTRATDAFHAGPGYNFQLDQGLDAINRRRAAGGMLNSGNADRDATNYAEGLANQEFNNWRTNLTNFTQPELSAISGAASGTAGTYTAGANIENQYGQNTAGVQTNRSQMLSDLAQRRATGEVGLATGLANPYTQTYGQEAAAEMGGSKNLWDLGLNAAALATGQYGRSQGAKPQPYYGG